MACDINLKTQILSGLFEQTHQVKILLWDNFKLCHFSLEFLGQVGDDFSVTALEKQLFVRTGFCQLNSKASNEQEFCYLFCGNVKIGLER